MSQINPASEPLAVIGGKFVSRLCFGTLTMSPLQRNLSADEGAELLVYAADQGVNFIDTAELYQTYPHIQRALCSRDFVISTKTYAYDAASAEESFHKAVEGIGREYIDLFLLHEQESEHTLRGHAEALEWLFKKQREGFIGAVGISTHHVAGVKAAIAHGGIQAIHPLINLSGIGIADGSREEMENAIRDAHKAGIFIYAMKPLGGGHLIRRRREALEYMLGLRSVHSIAVGMQSIEEIDYNLQVFASQTPNEQLAAGSERTLMIHDWCEGCGQCVNRCATRAMRLVDGHAQVDSSRCSLCGYCAADCPQFCIKVV